MPRDAGRAVRTWARYAALVLISAVVLLPIWVMVVAAFKPGNTVLRDQFLPTDVTLDTLRDAWEQGRLGRALLVSLVVAVIVTAAQLITSVLSAYAFAFLRFPGRTFVFAVFVATLLVPLEATLVINRRTIQDLGWLNSFQGLTAPFLATALGTFLVRQVLLTIPVEMREAARMDGVGHLRFMGEVAVPLARPTLGALALFSFLTSWNQYLWPVLITTDDDWFTVQSGLRALRQGGIDRPNLAIGGTIVVALPILAVLVVFQRQLVRGLTAGAVKG